MSFGHRSFRVARHFVAGVGLSILPSIGAAEAAPQQGPSGTAGRTIEAANQGPRVHPEDASVRIPLEAYLRGHATGDSTAFRRAFWKDARLWWTRDGMVATRTTDEYIASESGEWRRDALHRRRIVRVEISGETAIATVEVDYPSVRFTDHITLLKVGEEWRIISKAFISEPLATVT